jgi:hypothetical protein
MDYLFLGFLGRMQPMCPTRVMSDNRSYVKSVKAEVQRGRPVRRVRSYDQE